jgi:biotin carboxyl carrier protein
VKLRITLEGTQYEVDVEIVEEPPQAPLAAASYAPRPVKPVPPPYVKGRRVAASDDKTCRSPLAGVVSSIAVAVGQEVAKNSPLLVIEAMKMETKLFSQAAGTIKSVRVAAGDSVKPGQVLIELE